MSKENPIFQVLPTSGNQGLIAAGNKFSDLAAGQLGIFNAHTGLSVDGTALSNCRDIILALGVGGTDVRFSAGQFIEVKKLESLTLKGYMPETEKVIEITNFTAKCETEYAIKLTYRNQKSYRLNGYNQFTKTFTYYTPCCTNTSCDDCGAYGSAADLANGLATDINADDDAIVVASLFGMKINGTLSGTASADGAVSVSIGGILYTATVTSGANATAAATALVNVINTQAGSPYSATNAAGVITIYSNTVTKGDTSTIALVTANGYSLGTIVAATKTNVANYSTFIASYPNAGLGIRITGVAETRSPWNGAVNPKYTKTGTDFDASLVEGFTCTGLVTVTTNLQYSEGSGYDVKQLEYVAGGWNGKPGPYRVSLTTNLPVDGYEYLSSESSNYNLLIFKHGQSSSSGFMNYDADLETIVAIPCADGTTLTGLTAVLDLIFTQFKALSTAAAAIDCTNTQTVADAANELVAY